MIKSEMIVQSVHWLEKSRKIIIWMIVIIVVAASLVYIKANLLIDILVEPLNGLPLHFMTPSEGLMAKLKISFLGGIVIAAPFIAFLIVRLAGPALTKKVRRLLIFLVIPLAFLLFLGGMYFGYTLVIPTTIKFLIQSGEGFMIPLLSASKYFSFIVSLLFCIGLIFGLPLVLVAISRVGIITSKMLKKKRKITIMMAVIVTALVTPTADAFTLVIVTLPVLVLYEISIWTIFLFEKNDMRKKRKELKNQM